MSDTAYIKPSKLLEYRHSSTNWMIRDIADSHAVADSVMRELAEALRMVCKYGETKYAGDALARFDALEGNP